MGKKKDRKRAQGSGVDAKDLPPPLQEAIRDAIPQSKAHNITAGTEMIGYVETHCTNCPRVHGVVVFGRTLSGSILMQIQHEAFGTSTTELLPGDMQKLAELLNKHSSVN